MPRCAAFACSKLSTKGCGNTFHLFPKNIERRQLWVARMRRQEFKPSNRAVLCSDHFEEAYFDKTGQTVRLRPDAVPTIFNFPDHLQKKAGSRKPPARRQPAEQHKNPPEAGSNHQQTSLDKEISAADHQYCAASPLSTKRKLHQTVDAFQACKKRLKLGQQQTRRLQKKVEALQNAVDSMQSSHMISESSPGSGCITRPGHSQTLPLASWAERHLAS
ncbi:THAP domain-containing protein 2-like isoform X1 [Acipenser ruthenus]|uniref:THAP domain-containing protein 2-like isoform X1 n=2 Tax=Acipenser ruthenus TaxID=7906 RepID=UPI002741FB4E|nr:THAP domain-containing protein 2-like isoform X1 [Acipenser ruthenus]XP_058855487.1 THAP domain-containing protein 2-like isoform X1 [Acipenser ruthenus]